MRVEECTDWRAWRALRLEALADTPIGYGETLADAQARTDEEWAERWVALSSGPRFLAYDGGTAVGLAGGFVRDDGVRALFGVYVRPQDRGRGVLGALVDAVQAWAAPHELHLDVHVDNRRGRRAYEKLGFTPDGRDQPGHGIDGGDLEGMSRSLQAGAANR